MAATLKEYEQNDISQYDYIEHTKATVIVIKS